ncbi:MAG: SEL1-like repeat protein [Verrucomicrobia bacterium]|nr:SEL1-like repeat protein [Verrucomicrobiota bacterium]
MRVFQTAIPACREVFCVALITVIATASAQGQYKLVQGRIVPKNSPDWTVISDGIEVTGFSGGALVCRTFTQSTVDRGKTYRSFSGVGYQPNLQTVKNYKDSFVLTNYPAAGRFVRGDIIPSPLRAMRSTIRSRGEVLYDCGVDYVPPARKLTPEEAEAAKAQAAKVNDRAEVAKLKFDEEQAENGKDLYQYRMGVRYLKGDGVSVDKAKAVDYLTKSAGQGNRDAQRELDKLSARAPQPQTNASPAGAGEH